jgi:CRISPR-associated protein Csd1
VSGQETPDLLADSLSLFDETDEEKINEVTKISYHDAGQTFARKLSQKIAGYKAELKNASNIVVMGLDSAGPGRLSISFYRELSNSEFLERIESWHSQMAWFFLEFFQDTSYKKKKHSGYMVIAPAPRIIAEACYGIRLDDKLKKSTIERLLPSIVDRRQIPIDLVDSAVKRASIKIGIEHWEWERTLSVACALYRCYSIRNSNNSIKNQYTMALENERTDRDYLYGRLLAVAEYLEEKALYLAGENRITNAARLMQRFSDQPFQTWLIIEQGLDSYKTRLQSKRPHKLFFLKNLMDEIHSKFLPGDYEKEGHLTGLYLLGYHCQRLELIQKIEKEELETEL